MKDNNKCSIISESRSKTYTCLSKDDILTILRDYSSNVMNIPVSHKTSKLRLYKKLSNILLNIPETEWHSLPFINNDIKIKLLYNIFKIKSGDLWLKTNELLQAGKQIQIYVNNKLGKFNLLFYNVLPADYFTIFPEKINSIQHSKHNIGIIFNTDTMSKPGTHWVGLYITPSTAYYFDSNGKKPNKHIYNFLNKLNRKININKQQYQHKDGLCGMFSLYFILRKALNKTPILDDYKLIKLWDKHFY